MKITVFTSNQPRHTSLIDALADVAEEVFAVRECNTVFPGRVEDFFRKSEVMQTYFTRVLAAEREVFGAVRFNRANVRQLPIKMGDLNRLSLDQLDAALESDYYVTFGCSYIKGPLCEHLCAHQAVNIHMGLSPWYRGSSTNFWPMYDRRPEYVGATVHLLTAGLDSGPMLFHAAPEARALDPFVHGMRAVQVAHQAVVERLSAGTLLAAEPVEQDRTLEIRYTRNRDFTDEVAAEYLNRLPTPEQLRDAVARRDASMLLRPTIA
jgi:folate-dependent phosphoribosylglycinamide formyltransferase PurN